MTIADYLPEHLLFPIVMLAFKANKVHGHYELGRMILPYVVNYSVKTWRNPRILTFSPTVGSIVASAVSRKNILAIGDSGGTLMIWDLADPVVQFFSCPSYVRALTFSGPGDRLLTTHSNEIAIWLVVHIKGCRPGLAKMYTIPMNFTCYASFLHRSNFSFMVCSPVIMHTYRLGQESLLAVSHEIGEQINSMAFAPNGRDYCTVGQTVSFWRLEERELHAIFCSKKTSELKPRYIFPDEAHRRSDMPTAAVFSTDSLRAVTARPNATITIWDVEHGLELASIRLGHAPYFDYVYDVQMTFLLKNKLIAVSSGKNVFVVDANTLENICNSDSTIRSSKLIHTKRGTLLLGVRAQIMRTDRGGSAGFVAWYRRNKQKQDRYVPGYAVEGIVDLVEDIEDVD